MIFHEILEAIVRVSNMSTENKELNENTEVKEQIDEDLLERAEDLMEQVEALREAQQDEGNPSPERPDYAAEILDIIRSNKSEEELFELLDDYHDNDLADALELMTEIHCFESIKESLKFFRRSSHIKSHSLESSDI